MSSACPPIALILFNRPKCTQRVFEQIREARPGKLYLIADGPRPHKAGEAEKCAETRGVVEGMIDWDCEVRKNFAKENLGCRMRPATGISWVFEHEEAAVILEDDCLPDPTFFPFCAEMLDRYREREEVMLVCGTNSRQYVPRDHSSYFFSRYSQTWGWATWKRAWSRFDIHLTGWPALRDSEAWQRSDLPPAARSFYEAKIDEIVRDGLDAWDYGWSVTIALHKGKVIIPARNLVENVGFGMGATHTLNPLNSLLLPRSHSLPPPYSHPASIAYDNEHDEAYAAAHYANARVRLREFFFRRLARPRSS